MATRWPVEEHGTERLREIKPSGGCPTGDLKDGEMVPGRGDQDGSPAGSSGDLPCLCSTFPLLYRQMMSNKLSHDLMCLYAETHSVPEIILRITADRGTV